MDAQFLGIDIGSSYTKFVIVDDRNDILFEDTIQTLSRNRQAFENVIHEIDAKFQIRKTCTTGYGRNSYKGDIKRLS